MHQGMSKLSDACMQSKWSAAIGESIFKLCNIRLRGMAWPAGCSAAYRAVRQALIVPLWYYIDMTGTQTPGPGYVI